MTGESDNPEQGYAYYIAAPVFWLLFGWAILARPPFGGPSGKDIVLGLISMLFWGFLIVSVLKLLGVGI